MKKSIAIFSSLLLLSGCGLTKEEVFKRFDHNQQYQVKSVEIPYQDFLNPSLYKDNLYATVNDKSTGTNKLIQMNMKTKKITSIFKSKFNDPMIQGSMVNKDWLIWVDAVADAKRNKTYVMNKKTKKITQISASVPGLYTADAPFLYKDYVAFVYVKENRECVVRLYDLKRNTYKDVAKVNNLQLYNNFVHMAEGKLVWTDTISEKGYYYVYDLKTGQIKSHESPFKYPGYAKLTNNKIFAIHFDDFRYWNNQHFGYYDINDKEFVDVDTHSKYINSFDVHGDSLAIIDDKEFSMYQLSNKSIRKIEVNIKTQPNLIAFSSSGKLLASYYSDLKPIVKIVE